MQLSTNGVQATKVAHPTCPDPGAIAWNYSRSETIADLAVHIVGLCLGVTAAAILLALAATRAATTDLIADSIYAFGLLSVLTLSASYNLWPVCPLKWWLRRMDQSAIYLLIAATYTRFAVDVNASAATVVLIAVVRCGSRNCGCARIARTRRSHFNRYLLWYGLECHHSLEH